MKRLLICASCVVSMVAVVVAVVMAIGVELAQRKKPKPEALPMPPRVLTWDSAHPPDEEWIDEKRRGWREAMAQ